MSSRYICQSNRRCLCHLQWYRRRRRHHLLSSSKRGRILHSIIQKVSIPTCLISRSTGTMLYTECESVIISPAGLQMDTIKWYCSEIILITDTSKLILQVVHTSKVVVSLMNTLHPNVCSAMADDRIHLRRLPFAVLFYLFRWYWRINWRLGTEKGRLYNLETCAVPERVKFSQVP